MALVPNPSSEVRSYPTDADRINTRFDDLYDEINGELSNPNFAKNATIAESKLSLNHRTADLNQRSGGARRSIIFRENHKRNPIFISLPVSSSFIPAGRMDSDGVVNTGARPFGLAYDEDRGVLWTSDNQREIIYQVNTSTGAGISSFYIPNTGPLDVGYEDDNLWIIGSTTNEFYRYNTLGTVLSSFDQPSTSPHGITVFGGRIFYSEDTGSHIYRLNTLGTILHQFLVPGGISNRPRGLGDDGKDLWLSDSQNSVLYKMNTVGTILSSYMISSYGPAGSIIQNIMGIDYDGSHVWTLDSLGWMLRCLPMKWSKTPTIRRYRTPDSQFGSIRALYSDQNQFFHYNSINQTTLTLMGSFAVTESSTATTHDIAIKRPDNRTAPDLYVMTANSAAAAGNVVSRFVRGTFSSSFTLANLTGFLYFRGITFGDNYLWLSARDQTNGNVFVFQIQSSVYDVDTTGAVALSSFNGTANLGDLWGIDYADWDSNRHFLWASTGATGGLIAKINTTGGTPITSFAYSLGGSETGRGFVAPNAESIIFSDITGELIYHLNTLGTIISSWNVSSSGANPSWSGLTWDGNSLWISGEPASGSAEVTGQVDWMYQYHVSE